MANSFHIVCMKQEFHCRQERNSHYSLSAFARDLKISPASLSEIFAGKRNLSYKGCQKVFETFQWSTEKRREFLFSAAQVINKSGAKRINPEFKQALKSHDSVLFEPEKIEQETFTVMAEWYHSAIMEMTFTDEFTRSKYRDIAKRLGLSEPTISGAVQRLLKLGLLVEEKGILKKVHKNMTLADPDQTRACLVRHQHQVLKMAKDKLSNTPIEKRNNSGMVMAIDPDKIPQAKKEIRLFLYKMSKLLESGLQKEVYQLNINLFSLEEESR